MNSDRTLASIFRRQLERLHAHQGGAIAMMTMAALLILMMMAWVVFDAGNSARDALDVQASADTASWSQSAVEARSMNMLAFANVGKRVTFGMTSFYQALWLSWAALLVAAAALTVACWIANIPLFGAITAICKKLTVFTVQVGLVMVDELQDLIIFETDLVHNYFKDDLKAFDDYQKYMVQLTPWWSWAEGFTRGARNGALVTGSFPVPERIGNTSFQTSLVDKLPVVKAPTARGYTDMCAKVYTELDIGVHVVDYGIKSSGNMSGGSGWERPLAFVLTGLMALGFMIPACAINALIYGDVGAPYEMERFTSEAMWQLRASNLTFAYAPNLKRFAETGDRKKYNYLSPDYTSIMPHYKGGGYFGMARSEISFQDGTPDLWKTSWTARMRPVALPGEWSSLGSNVTLVKAWRDTLPYLAGGAAVLGVIDSAVAGEFDLGGLLTSGAADLVLLDSALGSLTDDNIEGLAK